MSVSWDNYRVLKNKNVNKSIPLHPLSTHVVLLQKVVVLKKGMPDGVSGLVYFLSTASSMFQPPSENVLFLIPWFNRYPWHIQCRWNHFNTHSYDSQLSPPPYRAPASLNDGLLLKTFAKCSISLYCHHARSTNSTIHTCDICIFISP